MKHCTIEYSIVTVKQFIYCGVRAVRRACGAVVFVVAYFPAFCENIISKLLFAFVFHECWKHARYRSINGSA